MWRQLFTVIVCLTACGSSLINAAEFSGNISLQSRVFLDVPLDPNQHNSYSSLALEPELYHRWNDTDQSVTLRAFYRHDQYDEERTHGDIRELSWAGVFDEFEITAGISKVFWGVTESQHLIDIINQTDQVENIDGEDKLGQPMLRFSTEQDWGILDLFVLPGFRERSFSDIEGRPRISLNIDSDAATYESDDKDKHIDYAARWFSYYDNIELGLSYFSGTSRDPELVAINTTTFAPHYELIKQLSIDLLAITGDWTWKMELISRSGATQNYKAFTGGFEYTLYGILASDTDLGIVVEYLYDDRHELATSPFQNDLTTAFRFALNDVQSTEMLIGIITDMDDSITASFIEASRRLGDAFKLTLEARAFNNTVSTRPLHSFRQDDFVQADLAWYF